MLWCALQSCCGARSGTRLGSHCGEDVCDVVSGLLWVALCAVVCDVVGVCVRISMSVCLRFDTQQPA